MILSDPSAPPPAQPVGRLRRAWDHLVAIVETPIAWLIGFVLITCIIVGGFAK